MDLDRQGERFPATQIRSQLTYRLCSDLELALATQSGNGGLLECCDDARNDCIHRVLFHDFPAGFLLAEKSASSARSASWYPMTS